MRWPFVKFDKMFKLTEKTSILTGQVEDALSKSFLIEDKVPDHFLTFKSMPLSQRFFSGKESINLYVFPYEGKFALSDRHDDTEWLFLFESLEEAIQDGTRRFPNAIIKLKNVAILPY